MKFFNLDLHISVIADVEKIFYDLGHSVDNWSISGHSFIMNKEKKDVKYVNSSTWQNLNESMIDNFYNEYKEQLSKYDGFIVTHTPCFSLLYQKFEKPIITIASTRYEAPFSNNMIMWSKLNQFLKNGIDNKQLIPVANNKYDKKYTELFTEREWKHIPSLCEYTGADYTGNKNKFLYSSKFNPSLDIPNLAYKNKELKKNYSWQELADYKGIVHVPYNVSTMSIFEQYTSNIPLFFPSINFLKELRNKFANRGVLSETSWNQVNGLSPNSSIFPGLDDPNNYKDLETVMKWVSLSDFYDEENMPHVQLFDSFEHLEELLNSTNLDEVSDKMSQHNLLRRNRVYNSWESILNEVK
jgi:hypothetical protein